MIPTIQPYMTRRARKACFRRRLTIVSNYLPSYYGVIYKTKYGGEDIKRVYDVFNKGFEDWGILYRLIQVAKACRQKPLRKIPSAA